MEISESQLKEIIREEVESLFEEDFYEVDAIDVNEEYCPVCREAQELEEKKKKAVSLMQIMQMTVLKQNTKRWEYLQFDSVTILYDVAD